MMKLEDARDIAQAYHHFDGYLTRKQQKLVDEAKRLVFEHATVLLVNMTDDQDTEV